jgi:hypothetical protein
MKTSFRLVCIISFILIVAGLSSCNKDKGNDGIGTAEFSLDLTGGLSQLKSATTDSGVVSYQIMVSVQDKNGNSILSDKLIPLYAFGTGFISEKLEIKSGEFKLTKFMVINPSGAVIYAAPVAGSPLAYLTNKPLPLIFNIYPEKVTTIVPEVLAVGNQSPDQFGYANFGIQIIKPLEFYTICILDNPLVMAPTQMTQAKLTISNNNGWHYSFMLQASVNRLIIRGGSQMYTFLLEKEGYPPQTMQFTAAQLNAATKENPLILKIPWNSQTYKILFLQPGPDAGIDAMISNIEPGMNFGAYNYFEASYMTSESMLSVMRARRSLMRFNLDSLPKSAIVKKVILKLSYDVNQIPWDSSIVVIGGTDSTVVVKPAGLLQQIIEPWEENGVTWNNQPKTTELNQVVITPFFRNVNFIEVDVTGLFVSPAANALPNYGILFKLNQNERFKGFRFASSDYTVASMRPRLSVHYTMVK